MYRNSRTALRVHGSIEAMIGSSSGEKSKFICDIHDAGQGPQSSAKEISSLIEQMMPRHLKSKAKIYSFVAQWREIVGEKLADICFPERIMAGNCLFVQVVDAVWLQELTFAKANIIESINARGCGAVIDDIKFVCRDPRSFLKKRKAAEGNFRA